MSKYILYIPLILTGFFSQCLFSFPVYLLYSTWHSMIYLLWSLHNTKTTDFPWLIFMEKEKNVKIHFVFSTNFDWIFFLQCLFPPPPPPPPVYIIYSTWHLMIHLLWSLHNTKTPDFPCLIFVEKRKKIKITFCILH